MRILFSFVGGSGHLIPLVPIARAAEAAGHTVAFACSATMAPRVEAHGFTALATRRAPDPPSDTGPGATAERLPLQPIDPARIDREVRENFAVRAARERSARMVDLIPDWRPDLLVFDEADFGGMIAAEHLGLPYATVLVLAAGSLVRPALVAEPLDELRAGYGLPPDPEFTMPGRHLVLSPFPPSFRDPDFPLPATAHSLRSVTPPATGDRDPAQWWHPGSRPNVYLTLGTEFNVESGDLFPRLINGLRELDVNLLVTVGHQIDPAEFGPQPEHVRIERYVDQGLVLPHCDLVVSHGGSGSVMGALVHGLPMVLAPMGADQPANAARCAALGVGRVLEALTVTPQDAAVTVAEVLADPGYRQAAGRLRNELAALPGPERAVPLLEQIATRRRPLLDD
ncbi:MGT family glycosyltransferase [Micromonospora pisi]|uniref:MGT family glycosyltransferase n=1 Tax=Micromonospora pisi TaxID=589240 RepID=A0A495JJE8_9ACTN|nr:glycosyltransferase [Micromonospora pisi]RKR88129.1 MGT family glycosyltransferase [Micromonospora pisi]